MIRGMVSVVLMISGSLQAASANRSALAVVGEQLQQLGDVVDIADEVGRIPAFNADDAETPSTPVETLRRRLNRSDVVVIATPEYAGSLPGALKNALDWIVGSGELYSKPVVVISVGTTGGVHARRHLVQTLTWQGAHVIGELGISAPRTKSNSAGTFVDQPTIDELLRIAALASAAAALPADERLGLVRALLIASQIDLAHIAPMPQE